MTQKSSLPWLIGIAIVLLCGVLGMYVLLREILPKKGPYFGRFRVTRPLPRPHPAPPLATYKPPAKELLALGKKMYGQHCALCHGKEGMGDGSGAAQLNPAPTPYVWGEFRYGNRFENLLHVITNGSPNRRAGMASWGWLPKQHREALAHYALYLSAKNAQHINETKPTPRRKAASPPTPNTTSSAVRPAAPAPPPVRPSQPSTPRPSSP